MSNKRGSLCWYYNYPDQSQGAIFFYSLIVMFMSKEIFSKRRKIYAWAEDKPELSLGDEHQLSAIKYVRRENGVYNGVRLI